MIKTRKFFARALYTVMALALVAGLTVVPAVAANVGTANVTPNPTTISQAAKYTIEFATTEDLSKLVPDKIFIEFPSDTTVPVTYAAGDITVNGDDVSSASGSERVVTITVPDNVPASTPGVITVVFTTDAGIVNPSTADDTYTLEVSTSQEVTPVTSGTYAITPAPASFEVVAGSLNTVTVDEAFSVTITAKDAALGGGSAVTGYTGDHFITFTPTGGTTGPAFEVINFAGGEGVSTSSFISSTIGATDTIKAETKAPEVVVSGTSAAITVNPAAFAGFTIDAPDTATAGAVFGSAVTVTAVDADDNAVEDYAGTVNWTSTDENAKLPADYTFTTGTAKDNGVHAFAASDFVLKTAGEIVLTVTDEAAEVEQESSAITVAAASATALEVVSDVAVIRIGSGGDTARITVNAVDPYGNLDTTDVSTVTVTSSLGDITGPDQTLSGGTDSTATLAETGTDVGTATIKAVDTLGTPVLTYATTTVELVAATAITEVWVDDDYSGPADDGGHDWGVNAFATIKGGVAAVATGGTVNVAAGTYTLGGSQIAIGTVGLTLKSTDGAAVTIIDASLIDDVGGAIHIVVDDVTVEGFTLECSASGWGIVIRQDAEGATVKNNIITGATTHGAIVLEGEVGIGGEPTVVTGAIISGNVIKACKFGIVILEGATDNTISDNTITGSTEATVGAIWLTGGRTDHHTQGNTISGNTITSNAGYGIHFSLPSAPINWQVEPREEAYQYFDDNVIEANTISLNGKAGIQFDSGLTVTELVITGNDITDNTQDGIKIGTSWASSNAINNNNIYGNVAAGYYNICSAAGILVDAENNWWGTTVGTEIEVTVSGNVDYTPWLGAPYTEPFTSIDLVEGLNLISLPLIQIDPSINTVLAGADVTVNKVTYFTGGPAGSWQLYTPTGGNLTQMKAGKGYWIDVSASGSLAVAGVQLAPPGEAPPTYDVVLGWNLIGVTSTTSPTVQVYLGPAVIATVEAMYKYDASTGAYVAIVTDTLLVPGDGYWLAVNAAGKIYP